MVRLLAILVTSILAPALALAVGSTGESDPAKREISITSSPSGAHVVMESPAGRIEDLTRFRQWVALGTYPVVLSKADLSRVVDLPVGAGELLARHLRLLSAAEAAVGWIAEVPQSGRRDGGHGAGAGGAYLRHDRV